MLGFDKFVHASRLFYFQFSFVCIAPNNNISLLEAFYIIKFCNNWTRQKNIVEISAERRQPEKETPANPQDEYVFLPFRIL